MSVLPILMSGPMVRATFDDLKSQTRRVLRPQPIEACAGFQKVGTARDSGKPLLEALDTEGEPLYAFPYPKGCMNPYPLLAYGPRDLLWVRESWNLFILSQDGEDCWPSTNIPKEDPRPDVVRFGQVVDYAVAGLPGTEAGCGPWRPSIHMPRWASRLTLEVTEVRVQRVQDISCADALAEGVAWPDPEMAAKGDPSGSPASAFADLWDSLNAKPRPRYKRNAEGRREITHYESFPWDGGDKGDAPRIETHRGKPHLIWPNPWVAAYSYKHFRCNVDSLPEVANG